MPPFSKQNDAGFKQRRTLTERLEESREIRLRYSNKVPIICERYRKEQELPVLDKSKFLVPQEMTMSQLQAVLRNRMKLKPTQSLYVVVNKRSLVSMTQTLAETYSAEKDDDGFLYLTYASQEMFG